MTDQDNEIRSTDMPERFQVCLPLCTSSFHQEAWIIFKIGYFYNIHEC